MQQDIHEVVKGRAFAMSVALEERDAPTLRHCQRVASLAVGLGRQCGLSERELRLLQLAADALDAAARAGALAGGDPLERAIRLAAALNGVLLLDRLARVDAALFDAGRHAGLLMAELLAAWGAAPDAVSAAVGRIDALARTGPLAPPLPAEPVA